MVKKNCIWHILPGFEAWSFLFGRSPLQFFVAHGYDCKVAARRGRVAVQSQRSLAAVKRKMVIFTSRKVQTIKATAIYNTLVLIRIVGHGPTARINKKRPLINYYRIVKKSNYNWTAKEDPLETRYEHAKRTQESWH